MLLNVSLFSLASIHVYGTGKIGKVLNSWNTGIVEKALLFSVYCKDESDMIPFCQIRFFRHYVLQKRVLPLTMMRQFVETRLQQLAPLNIILSVP